jgi:formylglycine-generating enzyme required for sulfatase activity
MVVISAGIFMMGGSDSNEKPVHSVNIKAFAMGKTTVTQAQWQSVMGNNPSGFEQCGPSCPVEMVSWNEAQEFVQKLSAKTGKTYRLPSEAEWEFACRAGGNHQSCGSDNVDAVAWYSSNSGGTTHPVAGKQANAFCLYDMSGNVLQWVEDWYLDNYSVAPTDGSAWVSGGEQKFRVLRGGSRGDFRARLRPAIRRWDTPDIRSSYYGFRLARTLVAP